MNQTQAYRKAFNRSRIPANSASARACELAQRPRVQEQMKALWRETSKQSLLSHAEYLQSLIDDRAKAELAENWTAVSSFQRLIGQAIGSLSENHVFTERPDTADLVKRIAGTDPGLAERLTRALDGRKDFDA